MELDVTLGSTIVFLSPRQLHSFHAIFQALLLPTSEIKYFDCLKLPSEVKAKICFPIVLALRPSVPKNQCNHQIIGESRVSCSNKSDKQQ